VVTVLSVGVVHPLVASELLLSFFISCCSGTVLFIHLLGLVSSATPLSLDVGLDGILQAIALLLAQLAAAPIASGAEAVAFILGIRDALS
jgi:hypothetical protein